MVAFGPYILNTGIPFALGCPVFTKLVKYSCMATATVVFATEVVGGPPV